MLDMLYRVALAEFFTSPTKPASYDRMAVLAELQRTQLIRFDSVRRWVLVDDGREILEQKLDRERLGQLHRLQARKAQVAR